MPVTQKFALSFDEAPQTVARRLRDHTRLRLLPWQGSPLGGGDRPLGGWVVGTRFRVALDRRDLLARGQAVAVGVLEATPDGGTLITGDATLPEGFKWAMRAGWVLALCATLAATAAVILGSAPWYLALLFPTILFVGAMGVGAHAGNANQQVAALVSALDQALAIDQVDELSETTLIGHATPLGAKQQTPDTISPL